MTSNDCPCCNSNGSDCAGDIKKTVRESYAAAISSEGTCCSQGSGLAEMAGYKESDLANLPEELSATTFGCGNPVSMAFLMEGETVLDIGSGAGLDVILAARKVGPSGQVIGLDMTSEMIDKANENVTKAGIINIEFRLGDAENMPVEDESIDVIISNCVINLSPDKARVFSECMRVLQPGGRIFISDIVAEELPDEILGNKSAWCSCIAGAMKEFDYLKTIYDSGLRDIQIIEKKTYSTDEIRRILSGCCADGTDNKEARLASELTGRMEGKISSITVFATKKPSGGC